MTEASGLLLAGLRVIDAASFIAGPVASTILADLGPTRSLHDHARGEQPLNARVEGRR